MVPDLESAVSFPQGWKHTTWMPGLWELLPQSKLCAQPGPYQPHRSQPLPRALTHRTAVAQEARLVPCAPDRLFSQEEND